MNSKPRKEANIMFENFTQRTKKVMALANQHSQKYGHENITTGSILLGLIEEENGVAAYVLEKLDVDFETTQAELEKLIKVGPETMEMGILPLSPLAEEVIKFALEEAKALDHGRIGTEHILLGISRESESPAAIALVKMGVELEDIRSEVMNALGYGVTDSDDEGITVNSYKNGNVKSLQIDANTSIGLFLPGEYDFTSERKEHVILVQGEGLVKFPGSEWVAVSAEGYTASKEGHTSFDVAENSPFTFKCEIPTAYICHYG